MSDTVDSAIVWPGSENPLSPEGVHVFDQHAPEYDHWFDAHEPLYQSEVNQARGEQLPFQTGGFDFALLVTVVCFVNSVPLLLQETRRVLKPGGQIILGFIDRNSALGGVYEASQAHDKFYRVAHFHSVAQVIDWMQQVGFGAMQFCQTIFGSPGDALAMEAVRDGWGEGAFVVLSAEKNSA